jgi:hypothetical protein
MEYCKTWIVKRDILLLTNHSGEETLVSWQEFEKVLDIAHCVAGGLSYVHGHGTIHRDLKPRDGKLSFQTRLSRELMIH